MIIGRRTVPTDVLEVLSGKVRQLSVGCVWLRGGQDISEVFASRNEITVATELCFKSRARIECLHATHQRR
jgi:hypothetical protein